MAGLIPSDFIDELLNRVDIVEVIATRVTLKKTGQNYTGLCPFHQEKTGSFSVSQDKQFYYCFGCHATGNLLKFIMEFEHLEFVPAIEMLAGRAGMQVPRVETGHVDAKGPDQKSQFDILQLACEYYKQQLRHHAEGQRAIEYMKGRGLSGLIARDFGIGFAPPGWDNLQRELAVTNQQRQLLIDTGMSIEREEDDHCYDRFRDRIMFPIRDIRGRVIGFGGRVLGDDQPKYLNSPETAIFHKGRELYGLFEARRSNRKLTSILVVEGYMDVVALAQHGISFAVATLGTATTREHIDRLYRLVPEVVFCFDADEAGRKAAWKALEESLPVMLDGRSARFLFLPEGEDPDSMVRQVGQQGFLDLIDNSHHLPEFYFEQLSEQAGPDSIEGKARLSRLAMPGINELPEGVLRQLMIDQLAGLTGLDRERLVKVANRNPAHRSKRRPRGRNPAVVSQGESSLIRKAIAMLIRQPELVLECSSQDYASLSQPMDEEGVILHELIKLLREDEDQTPDAILEQFRQEPFYPRLREIRNMEPILSEELLSSEYKGLIRLLVNKVEEGSNQEIMAKLINKPLSEISDEEKKILRAMHSRKLQRKKSDIND